jgi:hypothetical protein
MKSCLVTLLLALAAACAQASEPAAVEFVFMAHVDPDGRVLALVPAADQRVPALSAELEARVREAVLAQRYERRDQPGGTLTTWIEGSFAPGSEGNATPLRLSALRAGPRLMKIYPPHYPMAQVRDRIEADLVLRLAVDRNGKASIAELLGLEALGRHHAESLRAQIHKAVRDWRFFPERHDGRPLPGEFDVALQYRIERGADTDWQWRGPELEQRNALRVPTEAFHALQLRMSARRR